jgi:PPM family protein phosphatase
VSCYTYLSWHALTDVGCVRKNNEDAFFSVPEEGVFGVADGMGGGEDGEIASSKVAEHVVWWFHRFKSKQGPLALSSKREVFEHAIRHANRWIRVYSDKHDNTSTGSTVVSLLLDAEDPARGVALHAGDSRLYLYRRNTLTLITADHSLIREANLASGASAPKLFKNLITRAVGVRSSVELEETKFSVEPGDLFLLCTDGLSGMVSDPDLESLLTQHGNEDEQSLAERLRDAAIRAGGKDNITVSLVRVSAELPSPCEDCVSVSIPDEASDSRDDGMASERDTTDPDMASDGLLTFSGDADGDDMTWTPDTARDGGTDHSVLDARTPRTLFHRRFSALAPPWRIGFILAGVAAATIASFVFFKAHRPPEVFRIETAHVPEGGSIRIWVSNEWKNVHGGEIMLTAGHYRVSYSIPFREPFHSSATLTPDERTLSFPVDREFPYTERIREASDKIEQAESLEREGKGSELENVLKDIDRIEGILPREFNDRVLAMKLAVKQHSVEHDVRDERVGKPIAMAVEPPVGSEDGARGDDPVPATVQVLPGQYPPGAGVEIQMDGVWSPCAEEGLVLPAGLYVVRYRHPLYQPLIQTNEIKGSIERLPFPALDEFIPGAEIHALRHAENLVASNRWDALEQWRTSARENLTRFAPPHIRERLDAIDRSLADYREKQRREAEARRKRERTAEIRAAEKQLGEAVIRAQEVGDWHAVIQAGKELEALAPGRLREYDGFSTFYEEAQRLFSDDSMYQTAQNQMNQAAGFYRSCGLTNVLPVPALNDFKTKAEICNRYYEWHKNAEAMIREEIRSITNGIHILSHIDAAKDDTEALRMLHHSKPNIFKAIMQDMSDLTPALKALIGSIAKRPYPQSVHGFSGARVDLEVLSHGINKYRMMNDEITKDVIFYARILRQQWQQSKSYPVYKMSDATLSYRDYIDRNIHRINQMVDQSVDNVSMFHELMIIDREVESTQKVHQMKRIETHLNNR